MTQDTGIVPPIDRKRSLSELLEKVAHHAALEEHRTEPHFPVHGPVTFGLTENGAEEPRAVGAGWALDLSGHGMALLSTTPVPQGSRLLVDLTALGADSLALPLKVVYCQQLLPGVFRIGGPFVFEAQTDHPIAG